MKKKLKTEKDVQVDSVARHYDMVSKRPWANARKHFKHKAYEPMKTGVGAR